MILSPFVGVFAGFICDRYGSRITLFIAGVGILLAPLLTAFISQVGGDGDGVQEEKLRVILMVLVYSVTMGGLALSFMTAPGPTVIGSWFSEDRVSFGMGIGEAGVATGCALMPLVAGLLLEHYGEDDWREAMKMMSIFGCLPILLSFVTIQRPHDQDRENDCENDNFNLSQNQNQKQNSNSELQNSNDDKEQQVLSFREELFSVFKSRDFLLLFASQFLFGFGYFLFLFCAVPYATIMGNNSTIYASEDPITNTQASSLMTWFGVASALGALLLGGLAAKLNNRIVLGTACTLSGLLVAIVVPLFTRKYYELAAVYAVLGVLFAAGLLCLPSMVVETFVQKYPHLLNSIMSATFLGFGIAGSMAPPIATSIQERRDQEGSYTCPFVIGGCCLLVLGVVHLILLILVLNKHEKTKSWGREGGEREKLIA